MTSQLVQKKQRVSLRQMVQNVPFEDSDMLFAVAMFRNKLVDSMRRFHPYYGRVPCLHSLDVTDSQINATYVLDPLFSHGDG